MCEVCKVREECDLLAEELEFLFLEYQKKTRFKQFSEADKAKDRATVVVKTIFDRLSTIPRLQEEMAARDEEQSVGGLFEMLRRQSGEGSGSGGLH